MQERKNFIMLLFSLTVVLFSWVVHYLHRGIGWLDNYILASQMEAGTPAHLLPLLNGLFFLPIILLIASGILFYQNRTQPLLPVMLTLTLTFASISIIAGGDGLVEYHFSIFMVLASLAYFEQVRLIVISAAIFAFQHIVGYFTVPELICGTDAYPFTLLMIHIFFVVFTVGVILIQIIARQRYVRMVTEKEAQHQNIVESLVSNISSTSESVMEHISRLDAGAQEASSASKDIAYSLNDMVEGANQQLAESRKSSEEIEEVSKDVQHIIDQSKQSMAISESTVSLAQAGEESMASTEKVMTDLSGAVHQMDEVAGRLQSRSQEIEKTLGLITDISEQTNLLALNAAIEAARAGEAGKGFAVVADEVRKLADQSRQYANDISSVLDGLLSDSKDLAEVMTLGREQSGAGIDQVKETGERFVRIVQEIERVASDTKTSFTLAETIGSRMNQLRDVLTTINHVADKNRSGIESISATSEEQMATFTEFTDSTTSVTEKMDGLQRQILTMQQDMRN
ncbi:methyl-accepting chemotaxis protein [Salisediminibacterium beveridgei]|uniref:Methyl-accepting chemotaxis protein tlpC n=1 Tax=Salisediminibacterium beveridgei TaxID=632773 RepID=A0A1D7QXN5_9BACI|nr:methyl-accepting chemotaxis protein [Salisediminibacterium beveridgei]AOM83718.1 Methyl-accepting chemotaxis protein tlpC [Salisediminibacterium beveridgei]